MQNEKRKTMAQNLKYSRFLILVVIFLFFTFGLAVFANETRSSDFIYLFHLYYDNGQLFTDRDFEFKYDVLPEQFVPETLKTQFPFRGEIITLSNQVASTFRFDPSRGDLTFSKGKISVKAPYAANGQKAVFYDAENKQLLTIFVNESSFCNEDGVCNTDRGEDETTCLADCRGATPLPPPGEHDGGQSGLLKGIIYLIIGLGVLGGWHGWKRWKSKQESPTTQFPSNLGAN